MGKLVDGRWQVASVVTSGKDGAYERVPRTFTDTISSDHGAFKPESGRYHLYVSYACPWAHRTLIYRELKDLTSHISVDVVHPDMLEDGWTFSTSFEGATGDTVLGKKFLREIYQHVDPSVSTTVTVPILYDKKSEKIVNNESSQIIRIFNRAFDGLTGNTDDYYPEDLREQIDRWNDLIYPAINNGVYRCGFAQTQSAYDGAVRELFSTLDQIEKELEGRPYLLGERLTEADLRLIPTLLRFDVVYYGHFKCNLKAIGDYKNISAYRKRLYALPAIANTTNWDHIKRHYYYSHESVNPFRIVPAGPQHPIA